MKTKLISLSFILLTVSCLTGAQVSSFCHCNLTPSFCDLLCCCDPDCTSSPPASCFNTYSKSYCPDSTFFSRIGTTYLNSQGCFYYNSSTSIQDQVVVSSKQLGEIIAAQSRVTLVNSTFKPTYVGYKQGDTISLSGSTTFTWIDRLGNCLTSPDTTQPPFSLKFGTNLKLTCKCPGCTTTPTLFQSFSSQTINSFKQSTQRTITIPAISDAAITSVKITFVMGKYGSQGVRYIQSVGLETMSTVSSQRTVTVAFVEGGTGSNAPSFFPQIPQDMFYPVFLLS